MWDLPGAGLEPVSPALAGRFLTTAPPGKSLKLLVIIVATEMTTSYFNNIWWVGGSMSCYGWVSSHSFSEGTATRAKCLDAFCIRMCSQAVKAKQGMKLHGGFYIVLLPVKSCRKINCCLLP